MAYREKTSESFDAAEFARRASENIPVASNAAASAEYRAKIMPVLIRRAAEKAVNMVK